MPHPINRLNALKTVRGQTKVFKITVKDQDGRAINLSSAKVFMTIKAAVDAPALVAKTIESGIRIVDGKNGVAEITLSSTDTNGLQVGTLKYDVWVELPEEPPVRHQVVKVADFVVSEGVTVFA